MYFLRYFIIGPKCIILHRLYIHIQNHRIYIYR